MYRTKHGGFRKARSEGILRVREDERTFAPVRLDGNAHKIVLLYDYEELLERGAPSADVRDGADTHTHAVDREPSKTTAVCGDDSVAELVAEAMPDMSADS